ncbi:hypothetical protein [Pedobacter psychrodurus]|jgi:hypothetical protein|uniref:hypothetical protein n=1 Tax=Pedobacter psychrodurus TaxID=2530456 RepID=UPI00293024B0|nr:hypothetical protein [Pedobacter psychrodurus]
MKNLKVLTTILLIVLSHSGMAQKPSTPEVAGTQTGTRMNVSFPFDITGVPFSQIPGSVWNPNAHVMAELYMSYYMEGDATKYSASRKMSVNIRTGGSWRMPNMSIEAPPYRIPGKKMVPGKTFYSLFIYQQYNGERSNSWNAEIKRSNLTIQQVPDQKPAPEKIQIIDKIILNPQPIPPYTGKKAIGIKSKSP